MTECRQHKVTDWIQRNHIKSTAVLISAIYFLWYVTQWSFGFAASSKFDGTGTAAIIAAVQVPASFYAKWAFDTYKDIVK